MEEQPAEQPQDQPAQEPVQDAGQPIEEVQAPAPELTPEQRFEQGYNALVEETGCMLSVKPEFMLRDDSTYSVTITRSVTKRA